MEKLSRSAEYFFVLLLIGKNPLPTDKLSFVGPVIHLAGKVAVDLEQSLVKMDILNLKVSEYEVTVLGEKWFRSFGIDLEELSINYK